MKQRDNFGVCTHGTSQHHCALAALSHLLKLRSRRTDGSSISAEAVLVISCRALCCMLTWTYGHY